jgi:hypothetical protein
MHLVLVSLLLTLRALARFRAALQLEILAMQHQLAVLERSRPRRPRLTQIRPPALGVALAGLW